MVEFVRNPQGQFYDDTHHDTKDGKGWSFADVDELRLHCETGGTVEGAAALLYRTSEDVRQKAIELGLIK